MELEPQHPAHRADANLELTGDRQLPFARGPSSLNGALDRRRHLGSAKPLALRPRLGESGANPLLDDGSLELGEHTHHLEERLAAGCRGVDALNVQIQIDPFA